MKNLREIVQGIRSSGRPQRENDEQLRCEPPKGGMTSAMERPRPMEDKGRDDQEQISDEGNSEGYGEMIDSTPADPLASDEGSGVKYKTCEWWHVGILMIAECISLGILSLPHAMATLGLAR
jgi:hypothetical protein